MRARLVALTALVGWLGACTVEQEELPAWKAVGSSTLSAAQREQLSRATQARDALFAALSGRLRQALEQGTPAQAISVCKDVAPQVAAEVGRTQQVAIGRTSQRLRNPKNAPPAWAAEHVAGSAQEEACFAGPSGELGVLLPIRMQAVCGACHGPSTELDAEVAAALAADYPQDRATGFRLDELRGWFWVEVGP